MHLNHGKGKCPDQDPLQESRELASYAVPCGVTNEFSGCGPSVITGEKRTQSWDCLPRPFDSMVETHKVPYSGYSWDAHRHHFHVIRK